MWLAERVFKQVKRLSLCLHFQLDFRQCQHSNFLQAFEVRYYYINVNKTSESAKKLHKTALKKQISDRDALKRRLKLVIQLILLDGKIIDAFGKNTSRLTLVKFQSEMFNRSRATVDRRTIFLIYYPYCLRLSPTKKPPRLLSYCAGDVTVIS